MGTAVVYFHQAMHAGTGGRIPITEEPELLRVTVTTNNSTATSSAVAPEQSDIAIVVPSEDMYYRVHTLTDTTDASSDDKTASASTERTIAINPGAAISFLDVS